MFQVVTLRRKTVSKMRRTRRRTAAERAVRLVDFAALGGKMA
jgi:hypothetical protein